jgi:hypothetical protein
MDALLAVRRNDSPAILAASSRFGKYMHEPLHEIRKAKVDANPVLEAMRRVWAECVCHEDNNGSEKSYNDILQNIKILRCSAKDIEQFSIVLGEFQGERNFSYKAGQYLSALINNCNDAEFVIHTNHLDRIDSLGYRNTKNIIVDGNVGCFFGEKMENGTMTVEGDAGDFVGSWMKGGAIIVNGNANAYVGETMKGGSITVMGDIGDEVAHQMKGGIIAVKGTSGDNVAMDMKGGETHLNGRNKVSNFFIGGKIFLNGELLIEK